MDVGRTALLKRDTFVDVAASLLHQADRIANHEATANTGLARGLQPSIAQTLRSENSLGKAPQALLRVLLIFLAFFATVSAVDAMGTCRVDVDLD